MRVRERPPLRLDIDSETPAGRHFRWAEDEPDPASVPNGLRFSTTMPGGFESLDCTLPRKTDIAYSDLERLSTLTVSGPGGDTAWQGRLERAPRASGDQLAVSPSAVGYQAHLEDRKDATAIIRDIDLTRWQAISASYKASLLASWSVRDFSVDPDPTSGIPSLTTQIEGPSNEWGTRPRVDATYDAGSENLIGSIHYGWIKGSFVDNTDTNWQWAVYLSDDDLASSTDSSLNLRAAGPGSGTLNSSGNKRFAIVQLLWNGGAGAGSTNALYTIQWTPLAVYGDHGLPLRGTEPVAGFYASDVLSYVLSNFAPLLNQSIDSSDFIIEHLVFPDPTTAAEMVTQANRFHLNDWAVWEDRTFHYHARGARGRRWRARVAPTQLSETGPQVDRLWNSVVVQFADVDGTTKTVGPVGSGADSEDDTLHDSDPQNPANELGIERRQLLSIGTATAAGATQVGRRFLQEQKLLDTSGQAQLVGHVEDDRGVLQPAWRVRAGDYITFTDSASPTTERRIVRTDYDHSSRTCSIDLDSPPEGLASTLERLGAQLQPLGLS